MNITTEYRILVMPDYDTTADDFEFPEDIAAFERDGAWGYVVEARNVAGHLHSDWEHVDSCAGFIGNDSAYMISVALHAVPAGVECPVHDADARGRVWDTSGMTYVGTGTTADVG